MSLTTRFEHGTCTAMKDEASGAERARRVQGARRQAVHIAEVARLAGVSTATVSRTLSKPARVNAATRERVLEVVRQTGYTPNSAGRSLRAARSMMVLVVIPTFITPFFSELLLGIDQALSARGYSFLIGNLHDARHKEAHLVEVVQSGQVDGVILLNGQMLQGPMRRSLADTGVPTVAVSVPAAHGVPAVLVQDREAAAMLAEHLLALGHRRIGYVTGPAGNHNEIERWAGFRDTLLAAGLAETDITRYPGNFHVASGFAAGRKFLADPVRPTAVFAASDMMAIGFMRAVHASGLRVPQDVSVVGFDGIEFADFCEPPLTTVRQPREAMGREAAELLVRLIRGEAAPGPDMTVRLPLTLRQGGSTACRGSA